MQCEQSDNVNNAQCSQQCYITMQTMPDNVWQWASISRHSGQRTSQRQWPHYVQSKLLQHAKHILISAYPSWFAKKNCYMVTIYRQKKINRRCPEYFHTVDVKACEFGYKSWKFQILPILSAMQGSAPAHLLQYKYKYNKDVGTFCILTSCFEIFLDKAMRTPLTPYQNWRTITGLMS